MHFLFIFPSTQLLLGFRIGSDFTFWLFSIYFCNRNCHKIFSNLKMFISRSAMKLPFTWGIRQNTRPLNTCRGCRACWHAHAGEQRHTLAWHYAGVSELDGAVSVSLHLHSVPRGSLQGCTSSPRLCLNKHWAQHPRNGTFTAGRTRFWSMFRHPNNT